MSDQLALFIDFENVAIWAEEQFFDLELGRLMEFLQSRGPVVVKRAYGDFTRFSKYRDDLLDNSVDLIQLYSVRIGKNRADIRLALDAFETAINRPQIGTIVIVSGDSDFGALAAKLREYGRYILGIGPRDITHALLVKSCDEFVYMETVLGQEPEPMESPISDQEDARNLLDRALSAHGKRGELPILAARLKQTMLSMDPTFNEANLGYGQFRAWLEDNEDLVNLFFKDLQLYVAPVDFGMPQEFALARESKPDQEAKPTATPQTELTTAYRNIFDSAVGVDLETRRDVLRDIYRELDKRPGDWTPDALLDELRSRYQSKGLFRSKSLLNRIWQLVYREGAFEYNGKPSFNTRVRLAADIDSQASFIRRAESRFVHALIQAGLELDRSQIAWVLLSDRSPVGYVQELLDDLEARGRIESVGDQYRLSGRSQIPLLDNPYLQPLIGELKAVQIPRELSRDAQTAQELAKSAMAKRSQDFAEASQDYLLACRLQWDAFERGDANASLEDLRWYVASYASVKAGELSQVHKRYTEARPYYRAFFSLVQEDTPLWDRMRKLINPMLHYYWRNLAREMGVSLPYTSSPANLALEIATQPDQALQENWREATEQLVEINPGVVRRVANQVRLLEEDSQQHILVAEQIEGMLEG